jgi:hypothetical protein
MSFYNTQNPVRFNTQNQNNYTSQSLEFLKSGFQQSDSVPTLTDISDIGSHTYTPAEMENRYTVRTNAAPATVDLLPTAAQIVQSIRDDQWVRQIAQDSAPIYPRRGFYYDWCVYNEGDYDLQVLAQEDSGVTIGASPTGFFVESGKLIWVRVTLTNTTVGSEEVYISVLTNLA